jgi:hypothetical protein
MRLKMQIWMGIHTSGPMLRDVSPPRELEWLARDDPPLGDDLRWKLSNKETDSPNSFAEVLVYVSRLNNVPGCGAVQLT